MNTSSNVYIIILTWNTADFFKQCMESLAFNTRHPAKLVLVDNGSDTLNRLKISHVIGHWTNWEIELMQYICNAENTGIPAAQNQALDWIAGQDDGPYGVVLLDADTTLEHGWLTRLVEHADTHPDVGIVGGAKSCSGDPCPVYHHPNGRWYVHDDQWQDPLGFMEGESVDFAGVYLRPELLARGLRFDLGYELYDGHDQDMTFRVRSWGYRIEQIDAGILHYGSAAMKVSNYQWQGGGKSEWSKLREKNVARFAKIWKPFLAIHRFTIAHEMAHMQKMNAKLAAEAGDRKEVPSYD